jgi:hypothetical protein
MNQALAQAERVLAVASPAYFHSDYGRDEWTAALVRDRGQPDRLLLVRVAPVELPPLLANRIYIDLVGLDQPAAARALLAGIAPGRAEAADPPAFPGARFPGQPPTIFGVPPRNPNFTGRDDVLSALRATLADSATGALVQASAVHGLAASARPNSPSSTPTAIRAITTWSGGWRPSSQRRSPASWSPWRAALAYSRLPSRPRPSTHYGMRCASATAGCWCSTTPSTPRICVRGGHPAPGGCWSPPATPPGPALPPPSPSICSPAPRRPRSSSVASAVTIPPWTGSNRAISADRGGYLRAGVGFGPRRNGESGPFGPCCAGRRVYQPFQWIRWSPGVPTGREVDG